MAGIGGDGIVADRTMGEVDTDEEGEMEADMLAALAAEAEEQEAGLGAGYGSGALMNGNSGSGGVDTGLSPTAAERAQAVNRIRQRNGAMAGTVAAVGEGGLDDNEDEDEDEGEAELELGYRDSRGQGLSRHRKTGVGNTGEKGGSAASQSMEGDGNADKDEDATTVMGSTHQSTSSSHNANTGMEDAATVRSESVSVSVPRGAAVGVVPQSHPKIRLTVGDAPGNNPEVSNAAPPPRSIKLVLPPAGASAAARASAGQAWDAAGGTPSGDGRGNTGGMTRSDEDEDEDEDAQLALELLSSSSDEGQGQGNVGDDSDGDYDGGGAARAAEDDAEDREAEEAMARELRERGKGRGRVPTGVGVGGGGDGEIEMDGGSSYDEDDDDDVDEGDILEIDDDAIDEEEEEELAELEAALMADRRGKRSKEAAKAKAAKAKAKAKPFKAKAKRGNAGAASIQPIGGIETVEQQAKVDAARDAAIHAIQASDADRRAGGRAPTQVVSFEIRSDLVDRVRKVCLETEPPFPLMLEYDFKEESSAKGQGQGGRTGTLSAGVPSMRIDLRRPELLRPYQSRSLAKMFGNGRARSGMIVLPCGAGKTFVGIASAATIKRSCIVLCPNATSVYQWEAQFRKFSTIGASSIFMLTAKEKRRLPPPDVGILVITTYSMIGMTGRRAEETQAIMRQIAGREWGLMVLDETH